jgi:hypothetical protein
VLHQGQICQGTPVIQLPSLQLITCPFLWSLSPSISAAL